MSLLALSRVALGASVARADPAAVEATWDVGAGVGTRILPEDGLETFGEFGFGGELSFQVGTFEATGNRFELRTGPFVQTALSDASVLGEVRASLVFTEEDHAQYGTFDLRVGGGYGAVFGEPLPHLVVTATGGIRSFRNRFTPEKPDLAFGSVLRLFLTTRWRPGTDYPFDAVFGLELEPTFLLPPWSEHQPCSPVEPRAGSGESVTSLHSFATLCTHDLSRAIGASHRYSPRWAGP